MNFLQKIYKKSKEQKGFTLVEMIVVLVIIAILAAITIPALLKYIDKAREKQIVIDARTAYLAAETAVSEAYAENITSVAGKRLQFGKYDIGDSKVTKNAEELTGLTESGYTCAVDVDPNWKITKVQFHDEGGNKTASMNVSAGGSWTVSPGPIVAVTP